MGAFELLDDAVTEAKIADDAVTSAKIKDGEIVNADINASAAIAYSKLATDPRITRIKTGTYTGDGAGAPGGQAITGVGFQPKYVMIWEKTTTDDQLDYSPSFKSDQDYLTMNLTYDPGTPKCFVTYDDMVLSLDSDGFTVADAGGDVDPNKNGRTYIYVAFG